MAAYAEPDYVAKVKLIAESQNLTVSGLIIAAMDEYINKTHNPIPELTPIDYTDLDEPPYYGETTRQEDPDYSYYDGEEEPDPVPEEEYEPYHIAILKPKIIT